MTDNWQIWIALLAVAASIAFLVTRIVNLVRHRNCRGSCHGCAASKPPLGDGKPLVNIERLSR